MVNANASYISCKPLMKQPFGCQAVENTTVGNDLSTFTQVTLLYLSTILSNMYVINCTLKSAAFTDSFSYLQLQVCHNQQIT